MKFGNPISDVNATITGGEIGLAPGTKVDTSGSSNLGVNSLPSPSVPATATVNGSTNNITGGISIQLLTNSSGLNQYILISAIVSFGLGTNNNCDVQLVATGTSSQVLFEATGTSSTKVPTAQIDLNQLQLPPGAGVQMYVNGAGSNTTFAVTLYYTQTQSGIAIPAFSIGAAL